MQTFPSPPPAAAGARNVSAAVAGAPASGNDAHGFSRMIRQHLEGRPAQVTPLMHNAMDSNPHSVVRDADEMFVGRSPYLKTNTQHGAARGAQEIRFTPVEVRKIARALQESGVEPAVAQVITNLADNPLGLTASDMLKAMAEVIHKPARITDGDMLRIASLLQGLDPEGGLSGQIVADVRSGQATQAWQKILGALNALDPGSPVVLERDEIVSLGKSLGLSDQTLDALHKAFGGNRYIELRPNQVEQFLTPLQHELGERQAQAAKLAAVFEKALSPVAQEARMRIAAEESAMARAARSTQHAAVLIKDTVTRNGLTRQDAANAPQAEAAAQNASARNAAASRNAANASQAEGAAAAQDAARNGAIRQNPVTAPQADSAAAAQRLENLSHRGGSDEAAHGESRQQGADTGNQNQNQKSAWADFLDRVRYQDAGTSHQSRMNDAMQAVSMTPAASQSGQAGQAVQPALPSYAPHVLRQVEQGLLTGMRDGSQRLELQLSPEHLGALTMVLTIKNGEISAFLRPERGETAVLLNQQMDQLRFSLEQQGIRVDKVEVQTQLQDERNAMTWQGMAQHNASQEQHARAEQGRILRIGRLHRGGSESLDQKMHKGDQDVSRPADVAGQGLDIIT